MVSFDVLQTVFNMYSIPLRPGKTILLVLFEVADSQITMVAAVGLPMRCTMVAAVGLPTRCCMLNNHDLETLTH